MVPLFAEISATAALAIAGAVVGLLTGLLVLVGYLRRDKVQVELSPRPMDVRQVDKFVTTEHCATIHAGFDARLATAEKAIDQLTATQRQQLGNVHRRIDDMLNVVARLTGVMDCVQQTLKDLNTELRELRARTKN